MAISFDEMTKRDHSMMLNTSEFGVSCKNERTGVFFSVIKTDAFMSVSDDGYAINENKPMFNTLNDVDIKQEDLITIDGKTFRVRETKPDGIGGIDVYLKD